MTMSSAVDEPQMHGSSDNLVVRDLRKMGYQQELTRVRVGPPLKPEADSFSFL